MGTKLHKKRKYYKFNSRYNRFEFRCYKRLTRSKRLALKREHLMLLVTDTMIDEFSKYKDDLYKSETPWFSGLSKIAKGGLSRAYIFDINGN